MWSLLAAALPGVVSPDADGLVRLAGGAFVMGASPHERRRDDLEQQVVEVREFFLSATAVTNEQFRAFRKATGHRTEAQAFGWSFVLDLYATDEARAITNQTVRDATHWLAVPGAYWRFPLGPGSGVNMRLKHPVVHVSYNDAVAYCKWAGMRLPSETEWEYAARQPHVGLSSVEGRSLHKPYPWGDEEPRNESAWRLNLWQGDFPRADAALDGHAGLAPADAFEPNAAGLRNMLGNVWEWTSTWYAKASQQRVLRGGSYLDSADGAFNHKVTTSTRMGNTADSSADNMGFRCARSASGAPVRAPRGYVYDNVKKKRLPPGAADPLKDGGKSAEELVQAIAAEGGAAGLQEWMDKQGLGSTVMSAADASKARESAAVKREADFVEMLREEAASHSFEDLGDDEAKAEVRKEEL